MVLCRTSVMALFSAPVSKGFQGLRAGSNLCVLSAFIPSTVETNGEPFTIAYYHLLQNFVNSEQLRFLLIVSSVERKKIICEDSKSSAGVGRHLCLLPYCRLLRMFGVRSVDSVETW